ncbi:MAG TPA: hypothetical protein VGF99_20000 [Myxococcota bacterium]
MSRPLFASLVALCACAGCEPAEDDVDDEAATLSATLFAPGQQVPCGDCSVDFGTVVVGTTRDLPLVFQSDGPVTIFSIAAVDDDACASITARAPGPFAERATTAVRLVAETVGVCSTLLVLESDAANADSITISATASVVAEAPTGGG